MMREGKAKMESDNDGSGPEMNLIPAIPGLKGLKTSDRIIIPGAIGCGTVDIWSISVSGITTLTQSHQNLIGLRLICNISA